MAAFARATGIAVEESQFEEWDSEEREFDLVVAAQSWHWVDPFEGASRAAHVLRPGGRAGFVWNVARHDPSIQAAFDEQYRLVGSDVDEHSVVLGRGTDDRFLVARDGLVASGMFDAPQQLEQKWTREYTTAAWLDHLPSHSDHAGLPPAELAALLDGIGQVIDDRGGSFRVTYEAVLVTALRS
jgi:SAM-dependent methyltransferase